MSLQCLPKANLKKYILCRIKKEQAMINKTLKLKSYIMTTCSLLLGYSWLAGEGLYEHSCPPACPQLLQLVIFFQWRTASAAHYDSTPHSGATLPFSTWQLCGSLYLRCSRHPPPSQTQTMQLMEASIVHSALDMHIGPTEEAFLA